MKRFLITITDLMVLSLSTVFFITLFMTGEILIMSVMGIFVLGSVYAYYRSRKKYLYGCCC